MGFYQKLKESSLLPEDRKENGSFIVDEEFYDKYPTIYHLRMQLMNQEEKPDIKELYLALHHIIKHRGHFLFLGDMEKITSLEVTYNSFVTIIADELEKDINSRSINEMADILKNSKLTKRDKNKLLEENFGCEKSDKQMKAILGLACGSIVNLSELFDDLTLVETLEKKNKLSFQKVIYDEVRAEYEEILQERIVVIDIIKSLYDWALLSELLSEGELDGKYYLSVAKVRQYEKHRKDLELLKNILKMDPLKYKKFFTQVDKANYCAYVGSIKKNNKKISVKKCSRDDFYSSVKAVLKDITDLDEMYESKLYIEKEIDMQTFLPLQVSRDNGVIPYQVNKMELVVILNNSKKYYAFLTDDIVNKIIQLFEFKVPYYVGPLNTANSKNSWMVRKEDGRILPWNFSEKVDIDESAERFIRRMTNKCTYLLGEDVLPKYSLLYSEFTVWNELNNVRYKEEKLDIDTKTKFFNTIFKKSKRVTGKMLRDFLQAEKGVEIENEKLSGFNKDFTTSLTSYLDFKKILGDRIDEYDVKQMVEKIILWISLYSDDSNMLKRVIRKEYDETAISSKEVNKILGLKYNGWGRLSEKFLTGVQGASKETGEVFSVIQALRTTEYNMMQLLSQEFTFLDGVQSYNMDAKGEITSITYDNVVKELYTSPSTKRAIWQVVLIAEEIKKIMGGEPKKIFVEMAREKTNSGETTSRRKKLIELYKAIKDEERDWIKELEDKSDSDFRSIKLFLYYTQMGRCMYTGEHIPLSKLADTNIYDRDHIYPQSKTKDDSVLNNLVLVNKSANSHKSDGVVTSEIQQKNKAWWGILLKRGLIEKEKYNRLTRTTPLTNEELSGFINRQLVESRQSSKIVAELFSQLYEKSTVVYVKANRVSDFKKQTLKVVKVRSLNDYHHAKDAYLNIVVGNVYYEKFTNNPLEWLRKNPGAKYSLNQMFNHDLEKSGKVVWKKGNEGTIKKVLSTYRKNSVIYTRQAICEKGELFNQQIVGKDDKSDSKIPIKKGMDIKKYGGYKSINPAYFVLVEYKDKKGNVKRTIEAMPIYMAKECEKDITIYEKYCEEKLCVSDAKVILPKIKKNAYMIVNGYPMHIRGTNEKMVIFQGAVQLVLDEELQVYLKKIEKYIKRNSERKDKKSLLLIQEEEGITCGNNLSLYDELLRKHKETIYKQRPAGQIKQIEAGREIFITLSIEEQCIVINEILHLFQCKPIAADLTKIGGSANAGVVKVSKNTMMQNAVLVHQSVTGLFEQRVELSKI